jgi:hypothetical protein
MAIIASLFSLCLDIVTDNKVRREALFDKFQLSLQVYRNGRV